MDAKQDKTTARLTDYVAVARDSVFIVAVLLYVIGFIYFYSFLSRFGISVSLRDVPIYQLFVYSYVVISNYFGWIIAIFLILVFLLFAVYIGHVKNIREATVKEDAIAALLIGIFLAVIAFYLVSHIAESKGIKDADAIRNVGVLGCAKFGQSTFGTPNIFIFSPEAEKRYAKRLLLANASGRLQLIYETPESYYVILHECPRSNIATPMDSTPIFVLRKSEVISYGVEPPE